MRKLLINGVEFLGYQTGGSESKLKRALSVALRETEIRSAYLAKIKYKGSEEIRVALCFTNGENTSALSLIESIFMNLFESSTSMDIIPVTFKQEKIIQNVCKPFYTR